MRTIFVIAALFVVPSAFAQVPPTEHPDTSGDGWKPLFQPDLSDAEYPEGIWMWQNDELTATEDQNIWTGEEYDNFMVDLEFKTAEGTNSGVIIYVSDTENWIPNSVEVQIADDYAEKWATSPKTWQAGAIFGHLAPTRSAVKRPGEWNRYTITAQDSMLYVLLNGEPVTTMNMKHWTSATTNPDGSEIPKWLSTPFAELPTRGRIGLQGKHAGAPVWFRNLRVKRLN